MRIFLFIGLSFLIFTSQINAQEIKLQKKAQREYSKKIKNIERLSKKRRVKDEDFNNTVPFLEKLTGIESYRIEFESCYSPYHAFIFPNQYNIQDWKDWYDLNKDIIFWNSTNEEICFSELPENLQKNPIVEYEKYLSIIDLDYSTYYEISLDLFDYAYAFLENLTGYNVAYDHEHEFERPTSKDILFYKTWLENHKEKLYWNLYTQRVELSE